MKTRSDRKVIERGKKVPITTQTVKNRFAAIIMTKSNMWSKSAAPSRINLKIE